MKKLLLTIAIGMLAQISFAQFLLPNSGFENWTGVEPDNWFTNNAHGLCEPVTKDPDHHSGSFSVRGEVLHCDTTDFAPNLGTPSANLFTVTQRYATLNFFYKFNKVNNDVIIISADISSAGHYPIGTFITKITATTSEWTPISIPFFYFTPDSIPGEMALIIGIQDTVSNTSSPGSYFLMDDFSMGGFIGVEEINARENVLLYSNPSDQFISFDLPEENPSNTISLVDVTGKNLIEPFHSVNSRNKIESANIDEGIYFLLISNEKNVRVKKIVVAR